ncbi:MAG: hypothetical protein JXR70_17335 [Spirochaetales bacterium]|nr:hypothetical protein [Spirochaetales bacterium]
MVKRFVSGLCLLIVIIFPLKAQESLSLEDYYAFPLSIGVDAQSVLAMAPFETDYRFLAYHIESNLKIPLFFNRHIRALIMGGFQQYLGSLIGESHFPEQHYDFFQLYTGVGLEAAWLISKNWEAGITAFGGIGVATFPYIIEEHAVSSYNFMGETEIYFAYNPSYNISLRLSPSLRYQQTWGGLNNFDGFTLGIGGALDFRMGEDPELVQRMIRSIAFSDITAKEVFPAIQASYRENPFASLTMENQEDFLLTDLKIYFNQPGLMDNPTPCLVPGTLAPGQKIGLEIKANFNQNVFNTQGTRALTGEIIAEYKVKGRSAIQKFPLVYTLHDVTAIQWDDDRKIAAFINTNSPLVNDFVNMVEKEIRPVLNPYLNDALQKAIAFYSALKQEGCFYQSDPVSPFSAVKKDIYAIDRVYLPDQTLSRASGDCDDLTALFCSLLESAGIETGFITTPGHIFPMFNTGLQPRESQKLFPDRSRFIFIEDSLWVPLEITKVENADFESAWAEASRQFHQFDASPSNRKLFLTRQAQKHFQPLGRAIDSEKSQDFSIKPATEYYRELRALGKKAAALYGQNLNTSAAEWNSQGILQARYSLWEEAEESFQKAAQLKSPYKAALVNLGNLAFIKKNYSKAAFYFQGVLEKTESNGVTENLTEGEQQNLLIKLALCQQELRLFQDAQAFMTRAKSIKLRSQDDIPLPEISGNQLKSTDLSQNLPFLDMWE